MTTRAANGAGHGPASVLAARRRAASRAGEAARSAVLATHSRLHPAGSPAAPSAEPVEPPAWPAPGSDAWFEAEAAASAALEVAIGAEAEAAAHTARVASLDASLEVQDAAAARVRARQDRVQRELARTRVRVQRLQAKEQRLLAELDDVARAWHGVEGGQVHMHRRSIAAEVAVPARVSDRTVEARMQEAAELRDRWPAWLTAFEHGEITWGHVRILTAAAAPLTTSPDVTAERLAAFAADALDAARRCSTTRLRKHVGRLADRALASPLVERHRGARTERRVWVSPGEDGMSTLGVVLPSTLANAVEDRLARIARTRPKDAPRTIPNVMADTAAELLLTGSDAVGLPGFAHIAATVHVTVPVDTLVSRSIDDAGDGAVEPAVLDDAKLLDVATARALAAEADVWRILFVDPVTDAPCGTRRHDPTTAQRQRLALRDATCRFPGCAAMAWRCDIDHGIPYHAGGRTDADNLEHLCRRHHMLKHHGHPEHGGTGVRAWSIRHLGHGVIAWTDPSGHVYVDEPEPIGLRARRPRFTDAPSARVQAPPGTGPLDLTAEPCSRIESRLAPPPH